MKLTSKTVKENKIKNMTNIWCQLSVSDTICASGVQTRESVAEEHWGLMPSPGGEEEGHRVGNGRF